MSNFNNHEYQILVKNLIGDAFYSETSYRGKISTIRQYAEVVVRKLLDIDPNKQITLGQKDIQSQLQSLPNFKYLKSSIDTIRNKGNSATHTQNIGEVSENDFEDIVDNLFNILAFPLINYFDMYDFGSDAEIMYSFSLLPPIIRYKVLNFLFEKYPDNIFVIDKLVLAIMKAFSNDEAVEWIEQRKDILNKMQTVTEKAITGIVDKCGEEIAALIQSNTPDSMYHLCKDKILQVGARIEKEGVLYSDFESALPHYRLNGVIEGNTSEIKQFNDIMEFLYLGRKEQLESLPKDSNSYIIMNFIS
ncbi:MAG: hypothetical protein R3Y24_14420 [Eubacteriales bacterium]